MQDMIPLQRHLAVADDMQTILEAKYNHGEHVSNSYVPLKSILKIYMVRNYILSCMLIAGSY